MMTEILSLPKPGSTENPLRDQSRAIQQQHEKRPEPRNETPREARWRVEKERADADAKKNPHKGY